MLSKGETTMTSYRDIVLADKPVAYWPGDIDAGTGELVDIVGGRNGILKGHKPGIVSGVGGSGAVHFNHQPGQFINVANDPLWSLMPRNSGLTVEVWLKLDVLDFKDPKNNPVDYIHWLGKGTAGQQEWTFRLYSHENSVGRPNRLSFYVFNQDGGEGAGAYSQYDGTSNTVHIGVGQWMHVVGTLTPYHGWPNPPNKSYLNEGPSIYHNGKIRNGVALGNPDDTYYGKQTVASHTLAPVTFPLTNASVPVALASGFHDPNATPRLDLRVTIMDDNGKNRLVRYTSIDSAQNMLVGCSSVDGAGTAAEGNAVQQGQWQISPAPGNADLCFGTQNGDAYLPGSVCQIAIYDSVLGADRIALHYSAGTGH
jgi:hypothetical protein